MAKKKDPKFTKLDKRIYNTVEPWSYSDSFRSMAAEGINVIRNPKTRRLQDPMSEEIWKYSLGDDTPLQHFEQSPYKPSLSKNSNTEYIRPRYQPMLQSVDFILETMENTGKEKYVGSQALYGDLDNTSSYMQNYTLSKGKDDSGKYISIYDKWDLKNKIANKFLDRKPETYDRMYYQENPMYNTHLQNDDYINHRNTVSKILEIKKRYSDKASKNLKDDNYDPNIYTERNKELIPLLREQKASQAAYDIIMENDAYFNEYSWIKDDRKQHPNFNNKDRSDSRDRNSKGSGRYAQGGNIMAEKKTGKRTKYPTDPKYNDTFMDIAKVGAPETDIRDSRFEKDFGKNPYTTEESTMLGQALRPDFQWAMYDNADALKRKLLISKHASKFSKENPNATNRDWRKYAKDKELHLGLMFDRNAERVAKRGVNSDIRNIHNTYPLGQRGGAGQKHIKVDAISYAKGGTIKKNIPKFTSGGETFWEDLTNSPEEDKAYQDQQWAQDPNSVISEMQSEHDTVSGVVDAFGGIPIIGGAIKGLFAGGMEKEQTRINELKIPGQRADAFRNYQNSQGPMALDTAYKPTFETGGAIKNVQVELENDEVFKPAGDNRLSEVDGKYHSQGGEGYILPEGSEVFGNLINPITNNMFKKDAMKLKKKQDKIYSNKGIPGTIGAITNERTLKQIEAESNNLFAAQEKLRKGGQVKNGIPIAEEGLEVEDWMTQPMWQQPTQLPGATVYGKAPTNPPLAGASTYGGDGYSTPSDTASPYPSGAVELSPSAYSASGTSGNTGIKMTQNTGSNTDWQDYASLAGSLLPAAYNLAQGMRPTDMLNASDYYNSQGNRAMSLMANRRFDVDPLLDANKRASATAKYNLTNSGASAGQQFGGFQAIAGNRMQQDAAAWSQKQNVDNTYKADEAKTRFGIGSEQAQTKLNVRNMNDANEAARRRYLSQGMNDVSLGLQNYAQMENQKEYDEMLAEMYPDMFPSVYPYMKGMQGVVNKTSNTNRT